MPVNDSAGFTGVNGDPLTLEEVKAIQALAKVAKRWPGTLRLVSMDGHLQVIHAGDDRFGHYLFDVRKEAVLYSFGIPNDTEYG